jgi:hypothetical protein
VALSTLLVVLLCAEPLLAWRGGGGFRGGSVNAGSGGWGSRSGGWGGGGSSWQGRYGNASGSRSVTQTGSGYDVNKQMQTQGGYSRDVNRDVDTQDKSVERSSTATNPFGQSASRDRTTTGEGGYANVEGSASTSTGREATGQGSIGRNAYGQPAVAGSIDTKYSGSYAGAAARNPYGGWSSATVGPYGGKVTTTLPSGYRTTSYYGRPYYSYGGAYYRPYAYGGMHYYYPVPPPYYCMSSYVPVGAIALAVAGTTYMMSQGSYYKQTTNTQGQVVYETVPAPQGAALSTLPASRVLVTVGGTTYFLYTNTFYRQVGMDQFVVVSPPAGVVFVPALPANFEVVQLNTMYFEAQGQYYVPYLEADGKELYALVDAPPRPPAASGAGAAPGAPPPPPATRTVTESMTVPAGTLILVRLASDLSSETANVGDRFQGFLDQDLAASGRIVAGRGSRVYGTVLTVKQGNRMRKQPEISVTLSELQVGDQVVSVQTQPIEAKGEKGKGLRRILGGAALGTGIGAIADGGHGTWVGAIAGGGAGIVATAATPKGEADLPAQSLQSFQVAVPFTVETTVHVAVN